jgi:RNA polymerase sigma factor (TIGR02999 family)
MVEASAPRFGSDHPGVALPGRLAQFDRLAGGRGPEMLRSRVATDFDRLIQRAESDQGSADELFALLYQELHRLAEHNLRRSNATITLDATTLLHEAYLNISGRKDVAFADQPSFLAYASRAMRGLVIDYARHRRALKRGRQLEITLADDEQPSADRMQRSEELERLGDAIEELSVLDPALAELVDLHFFCGFTFAEIAEFRGSSERTVQRDWRKARLLLQHSLMDDEGDEV